MEFVYWIEGIGFVSRRMLKTILRSQDVRMEEYRKYGNGVVCIDGVIRLNGHPHKFRIKSVGPELDVFAEEEVEKV